MEYLMVFLTTGVGVFAGIVVGAIPGLTATMAIALLVPFTFYMETVAAISSLLGLYVGAMFGGSISSILIGIPGTPAATATRLDGYPMGQAGRAGEAIGYAAIGSFVGGMVSVAVLFLVAGPIARFSLYFGSPEYFALALIGLTLCITLASGSALKGAISGLIGVLLALVGMDGITGYERFTFGIGDIVEGIPFIPTMIGLFGLSELFARMERSTAVGTVNQSLSRIVPSWRELRRNLGVAVRGGLIGSIIGAIPGTGGNVAAFLSYDVTKRASKRPEEFGHGVPEGVVAAESGNSGVTGGALIPLLTFGIPGDSVAAVLLGALLIHGLRPGPALFSESAEVTYKIFGAMAGANVLMLILAVSMARHYARLITVPDRFLVPIITLVCVVGAFAMRSSLFDVQLMVLFGLLGYAMMKAGFSAVPMVLGLILGGMAESNFRRSLLLAGGSVNIFLQRPLASALLLAAALLLAGPLWRDLRGHTMRRSSGRLAVRKGGDSPAGR